MSVERESKKKKKYPCMLILVSCGALSHVEKSLLSCRAWNCQGIGHVCYPSKTQTTTGRPEVEEFMDIIQQRLVVAVFTDGTKKERSLFLSN